MKVAIVGVMTILLLVGWFSFLTDSSNSEEISADEIAAMKAQAEEWADEGLYQRAAEKYNEIIEMADSEEMRLALIEARKKRYEEDSSAISAYISELESAVATYPLNVKFIGALLDMYGERGSTLDAYKLICTSEKAGMTDKKIIEQKNGFKYTYTLNSTVYDDFNGVGDTYYGIFRKGAWYIINREGMTTGGHISYTYISPISAEGVAIYVGENSSRLIDGNEMVLGIFPFEVTQAGIYSEGLIPVMQNGSYSYYNEFAKRQAGEYDYASSYCNGMAAVSENGKQYIIDKEGNKITDTFYKISADKNGVFMNNSVMVASKNKGTFEIYNAELEKMGELSADDADVYKGGYIAFCSGGKWGFADTEGNIVINPEYDGAKSFSNGLAAVCKNGKWGFINEENQQAIDYVFDGADYFNAAGCCMVMTKTENSEEEDSVQVQWQLLSLKLGIIE